MDPAKSLSSRTAQSFLQKDRITSHLLVRKRSSETSSLPSKKNRVCRSSQEEIITFSKSSPTPRRFYSDIEEGSESEVSWNSPSLYGDKLSPTDFGLFDNFPLDVTEMIVDRIPVTELARLAVTSKIWMLHVRKYIESRRFLLRFMEDVKNFEALSANNQTHRNPFFGLGTVMSAVLSFKNSQERIETFFDFMKKVFVLSGTIKGFGKAIYGFCLGRTFSLTQYQEFISNALKIDVSLNKDLEDVLNTQHGVHLNAEFRLRSGLHELFFDHFNSDILHETNRYWLSSFLLMYKKQGTGVQSKLLYLLFAPIGQVGNRSAIQWDLYSETVVTSHAHAVEMLLPIANALRALLETRRARNDVSWTKNTVFNLMEEVTTFPTPWSMITFVSLLLVQPSLIPIAITARMLRDHEDEAGDMIHTMKTLLSRWSIPPMAYLVKPFQAINEILSQQDRQVLFEKVLKWHFHSIKEFRSRIDRYDTEEMKEELESMSQFLPALEVIRAVSN